ncbi:MAG: hypothetical protein ACRCTG_16760 [Aestuariivirga sp.]
MSNINNGGPAFPHKLDDLYEPNTAGMTLRDYFAAKAMQSFLTHAQAADSPENVVAGWAYAMADAMLRAREAA